MAAARRMFSVHWESERTGIPVEEIAGRLDEARRDAAALQTRREFVAAGAAVAAAGVLAAHPATVLARPCVAASRASRSSALGSPACAAHISCSARAPEADRLDHYESNAERAGGRCWTLRNYFQSGLITEHGGQLINTDQTAVRGLARLLGLQEEEVHGGDLFAGDEVFFIDDALYTLAEADDDWEQFGYRVFRGAAREERTEAGAARLDAMSVPEWLDSTEIGSHSRFGKLMLSNTVTENGGDPADQSALDLIMLLTHNPRNSVVPLGGDDERYHIIGGNDQLVSGMIGSCRPKPSSMVTCSSRYAPMPAVRSR